MNISDGISRLAVRAIVEAGEARKSLDRRAAKLAIERAIAFGEAYALATDIEREELRAQFIQASNPLNIDPSELGGFD